ncbi:MAG: DNA polymerase III subunit gamma/tau [Clostridia bacterium]
MAEYQALYRKWRPLTFDDVVGQRHVTETIKNEVKNNSVGHAFLFCGSRGTGKTSTARIFSRAINCENPQDGNPCNKCPSCRGILDGSIMDITEIDAASNSGVDNIRSLREEAGYTAAIAKYRVYIIDEVHALSPGAFNALLKLLEEPPKHVKFVLATTEAHKVMDTISSRCQRFDFKRITAEDIYQRLDYICNAEGIIAEERALRMIASAADGSLRDALSCLDPCVAAGKEVDTDFVADFLGRGDSGSAIALCRGIAAEDSRNAIDIIEGVSARGRALAPFMETVIKALRDILVLRSTGKCKSDFSPEEQAELKEISGHISVEKLLYSIKTLSEALASAKYTSIPSVVFQSAVIKLCIGGNDGSYDALLARVGELERKISEGISLAPPKKTAEKAPDPEPEDELPLEPEKEIYTPQSEFVEKIKDKWPEITDNIAADMHIELFTALQNSSLREYQGKLAITFPDEGFGVFRDMTTSKLDYLKGLVKKHCGIDCGVTVKSDSDFGKIKLTKQADPLDAILGLPITEIE